jgi:ABC-type nitrate/sulfonate/bicarbonate transport system permease component
MSQRRKSGCSILISPIGLIALWQVLLMAGIGDRRFVPAPSDIAWRYWEMLASGELASTRW